MTSIQPFLQLAQLCADKGIKQAVISPGSRSAALTIAFTKHNSIDCISISDERSAGFIAMGMSLASGLPTVLICTSGTAALNYGPAIAEACFRNIPLIVLTADRPPEWIHQHDGQTVFQANCYGKHVLNFYEWLPDQSNESLQYANRVSNEGINLAINKQRPVHFNIPIREPFYPSEIIVDFEKWRNVEHVVFDSKIDNGTSERFLDELKNTQSRLMVIGQMDQPFDSKIIDLFATRFGFTVIADCISNYKSGVENQDIFLRDQDTYLKPDFLITIGESNISKSLKLYLRKHKATHHWHIGLDDDLIDPFVSITKKIITKPLHFFEELNHVDYKAQTSLSKWTSVNKETSMLMDGFWKDEDVFSDLSVVYTFLSNIQEGSVLHLGNSMSVRYVNALQKYLPDVQVHCNRGTSGIDGILSTAVGHALNTKKTVYCLLGDVSFQYDKNALWNNLLPDNLRVLILNNSGGVIFQMINGPKKLESFDNFFRTKQANKADLLALEYGLSYFFANDLDSLNVSMKPFVNDSGPAILEVFTDPDVSESRYKALLNIS